MTTAAELSALVNGRIVGDPATCITGYAAVEAAGPGDITFITGDKYRAQARNSKASALVTAGELAEVVATQIIVGDPNLAFAKIVEAMARRQLAGNPGIDHRALVHPEAEVDATATLHAFSVVERGARVGASSVLFPGVYVGEGAVVGENCVLYPHVVLMQRVRLGDRVIVHGGAVLGADGFGYATGADGKHIKIPQTGTVIVEDDVEIGACTCIDRARFSETRIRRGTKVDNLVQVAHNVDVGEHSLIVAQVGIAGSTRLGHHVVLGGHVGVAGHITIGDGAQVAAFSGVAQDLEPKQAYMGVPARTLGRGRRIRVIEGRLPEMYQRLRDLEHQVSVLRQALDGNEQGESKEGGS